MVCLVSRGPTTCEICGLEWKSTQSLSKHLTFGHGVRVTDYYDTHLRKDGEGVCQFCGGETKFYNLTYGYKHHCDASCKMKRQFRDMGMMEASKVGFANLRFGMKRGGTNSPEVREKIRVNRQKAVDAGRYTHPTKKDPEGYAKAIAAGQRVAWTDPETRKRRIDAVTKANRQPERRAHMSEVMCQLILDGVYNKTSEWISFRGEDVFVGSSYEKRFLVANEDNPDVLSIQKHPFKIPYEYEGATVNYLPDFLVTYRTGRRELIEIKPENLVEYGKNPAKFRAGREHCAKLGFVFRVVTESDLDSALQDEAP